MIAAIPFPGFDPALFTIPIFGMEFALRWYALAYIVGIVVGWRLAVLAVNRPALWTPQKPPMTPAQIEELLTAIILGIIIGGRLGFVLFYQPGYYLQNPLDIPKIWQGGMAFHGGFLGVVVAAWWFAHKHRIAPLPMGDVLALATPVGLMLGRLANFINAELWGRPTDLPWGVIFPGQAAQNCGQAVGDLCARHPSQLYQAGLEGLLLLLVLLWLVFVRRGLSKPGLVTGVFLAGYAAARFAVEFVRQPDAQFVTDTNPVGLAFHINGVGLTMGQALSLPMLAVGLWLIWRARAAQAA